jgi:hypothetical protein
LHDNRDERQKNAGRNQPSKYIFRHRTSLLGHRWVFGRRKLSSRLVVRSPADRAGRRQRVRLATDGFLSAFKCLRPPSSLTRSRALSPDLEAKSIPIRMPTPTPKRLLKCASRGLTLLLFQRVFLFQRLPRDTPYNPLESSVRQCAVFVKQIGGQYRKTLESCYSTWR